MQNPSTSPFPDPIPGVIAAGSVNFFSGPVPADNLIMLADWARRWRDGEAICNHLVNRPTAIGYIDAARPWESSQTVFTDAGFPEIPHSTAGDDFLFDSDARNFTNAAVQTFTRALRHLALPPYAIVLVNAFYMFMGGTMGDTRTGAAMLDLRKILAGGPFTCIGLMLETKYKGNSTEQYQRPAHRLSGTVALMDFADTHVYLHDSLETKKDCLTLGWTPRHKLSSVFAFSAHANPRHFLLMSDTAAPAAVTPTTVRQETIIAATPDGEPITKSALADHLRRTHATTRGYSRAQIYRAIGKLVSDGRLTRTADGLLRRVKPS